MYMFIYIYVILFIGPTFIIRHQACGQQLTLLFGHGRSHLARHQESWGAQQRLGGSGATGRFEWGNMGKLYPVGLPHFCRYGGFHSHGGIQNGWWKKVPLNLMFDVLFSILDTFRNGIVDLVFGCDFQPGGDEWPLWRLRPVYEQTLGSPRNYEVQWA